VTAERGAPGLDRAGRPPQPLDHSASSRLRIEQPHHILPEAPAASAAQREATVPQDDRVRTKDLVRSLDWPRRMGIRVPVPAEPAPKAC
jgi:hypothetical protein